LTTLLVWLGAALVAYTIKGFSGFGPALIVVPTLSALYSPETALGTSTVIDVAVGFVLLLTWRPTKIEMSLLARLILFISVGTVVGALLAGVLPQEALLLLIGISVLLLAVKLAFSGTTTVPTGRWGIPPWLGGILAGVSGGLVGISGPFMVAGTSRYEKSSMRRLLVVVFLVEGLVKLVVYSLNGILTRQCFDLGFKALPAIIVGLVIGAWLHNRVSQQLFLRVLAGILFIAGLEPIVTAIH
jgi:uncharacterized protein